MRPLLLSMALAAAVYGCGDSPHQSGKPSLAELVQALADEADLAIVDVSVPFERLTEAPAQLEAVGRALASGPSGVYVMRYTDDTLRETVHVFLVSESRRSYVRFSIAPEQEVASEQHDVRAAHFDEEKASLMLETPAGVITLTPQDVTPVGA